DRERRHSDPEERSQPGRDGGAPPRGTPGTDESNNDRGERDQSARYGRDGPERGEGQREPNGKQERCRYGSAGREEGFGWQPAEAQAPRQHGPIQQGASDWSRWDVFPRARADHERERDQRQGRPRQPPHAGALLRLIKGLDRGTETEGREVQVPRECA